MTVTMTATAGRVPIAMMMGQGCFCPTDTMTSLTIMHQRQVPRE